MQQDLPIDGARYFDVDDTGRVLIAARRPSRIGGPHILTKVKTSLLFFQFAGGEYKVCAVSFTLSYCR